MRTAYMLTSAARAKAWGMGPVAPGVRADTLGPRPGKADYNFVWEQPNEHLYGKACGLRIGGVGLVWVLDSGARSGCALDGGGHGRWILLLVGRAGCWHGQLMCPYPPGYPLVRGAGQGACVRTRSRGLRPSWAWRVTPCSPRTAVLACAGWAVQCV